MRFVRILEKGNLCGMACPSDNCFLNFYLSNDYFGCPGQPDLFLLISNANSTDALHVKRNYVKFVEA